AAQVVQRVTRDGAYSNIALDAALRQHPKMSRRNRGLATELTYGTLTWLRPIDAVLRHHVHRKFHSLDPDVLAVLRIA
ncbi:MAG: transcription antitermination factor NusB, partial [Myxococcota bacterium]